MILRNKAKIESIIRQVESEAPGEFIYDSRAIYLYVDNCLFPGVIKGKKLSIHAAVPHINRGERAINAAKKIIKWSLDNLPIEKMESRIYKHRRHVQMFARLSGMKYAGSDQIYSYFEVVR